MLCHPPRVKTLTGDWFPARAGGRPLYFWVFKPGIELCQCLGWRAGIVQLSEVRGNGYRAMLCRTCGALAAHGLAADREVFLIA
jgi:hypothetical protein